MAGGGVGEAMLIGAAVGAGTGGVMSAAQDKDVGQGMLLGALGGAATGGIGSQIGGAAAGALPGAETAVGTDLGATAVQQIGQEGSKEALTSAMQDAASKELGNVATQQAGQSTAQIGTTGTQNWGQQGVGQGLFPTMSNAQVAGAATTGGITGLAAANGQPAPYQAPGTETYNGPLSKFRMAGPQLNQYSYDPSTFRPSVAPGYADGGIAALQTGMFPQSQMDRTQFATPSQMPISREIIGSDYDATINPYTGDLPRFADGGGINFIHNLQPGGEFGDITADLYGAVQEHKPQWLQNMEPGGFIGATVPGKLDWEEKKRKEEEQKIAQDRAAREAMAAKMYSEMAVNPQASGRMAHGGIADLGSYSDGGRLLRGPGDGMSDNIPATIAGKQPARLADGEFVIPADVVSGLGNGSTDAGAKTLYSMMDKVRKARTGTTNQGKKIHADKYMPKMAQGGIAYFDEGGDTKSSDFYEKAPASVSSGPQTSTAAAVPTASVGYTPSIYNPYVVNPNYVAPVQGGQFDAKKYLELYPDVAKAGIDPLQHYQIFGKGEGRQMPLTVSSPGVGTPTIADPRYSSYTIANRPSSVENQFYGDIYRGETPDYSTPGYTLTGGNLGRWSNVAGEARRAAQPASMNQQITQAYLQNLGRAPDQTGFNYWMNDSSSAAPAIVNAIAKSPEAEKIKAQKKRRGGIASLV